MENRDLFKIAMARETTGKMPKFLDMARIAHQTTVNSHKAQIQLITSRNKYTSERTERDKEYLQRGLYSRDEMEAIRLMISQREEEIKKGKKRIKELERDILRTPYRQAMTLSLEREVPEELEYEPDEEVAEITQGIQQV